MAEPGAEEPDERLLLLVEPPPSPPEAELPRRGPQSARAAPGGAVRQCGEPGLEEVEDSEDSGPEGDGEDEPLLRASGGGRGRRAGAGRDRERRAAAGTARSPRGGSGHRQLLPCSVLPAGLQKYLSGLECAPCAVSDGTASVGAQMC